LHTHTPPHTHSEPEPQCRGAKPCAGRSGPEEPTQQRGTDWPSDTTWSTAERGISTHTHTHTQLSSLGLSLTDTQVHTHTHTHTHKHTHTHTFGSTETDEDVNTGCDMTHFGTHNALSALSWITDMDGWCPK